MGEYLWNHSRKDKTFSRSPVSLLFSHLSAGPIAKPMQKATSPKAYTLPYTAECRMSTRYPSSGIMHESTIPIAKPRPALGIIRWNIDVAEGICFGEMQLNRKMFLQLKATYSNQASANHNKSNQCRSPSSNPMSKWSEKICSNEVAD